MSLQRFNVNIFLSQKDFSEDNRLVFKNKVLILNNFIRYISLNEVLEILEYDYFRKNPKNFVLTDGSEFVSIPRQGDIAKREGVLFRIDPLLSNGGELYLSFRSINRLFNVEISADLNKKRVFIRQPGRFFVAFKGDTLRSIARLLNTTIKRLLAINKNLKEPIQTGTRIRIPTLPDSIDVKKMNKRNPVAKIMQADIANAIISFGRKFIGTPYRFGAGPYPITKRFDCSSYTQYIFGRNGVGLPRTARAQSRVGKAISRKDIEAGDLIFFRRPRYSDNRVGHVGVDIGNGQMLNTYQSPPGVTITHWRNPVWLRRYITAREIL